MTNPQTESKQHAAEREVDAMLNLSNQETERIDCRFFKPACEGGSFLAEMLWRKLAVMRSLCRSNIADPPVCADIL
jgi:hypothetical protein